MDTEKQAPPPSYPIIMQGSSSDSAKPKKTKKYVVAGVTVVIVTLLIVGGVLGAMKMSHEHARDTIEQYRVTVTTKDNDKHDETVSIDKNNQATEIDDDKQDMKIYNDFKRSLTIMKMSFGDVYACYLAPLKDTEKTPEAAEEYMQQNPNEDVKESDEKSDDVPRLVASRENIVNRDFLSEKVREMCNNLPMHWLLTAPDNLDYVDEAKTDAAKTTPSAEANDRQKRACYYRYVCYRRCYYWYGYYRCQYYCYYRLYCY